MMEGYAQIGSRMASQPELTILRSFTALNAQNLLYLQAELIQLESQLRRFSNLDIESGDEKRKLYSRDWFTLSNHAQANDAGNRDQWNTALAIREMLKEYNMALQQQAFLLQLKPPMSYDLQALRSLLEDANVSTDYLLGLDSTVWARDANHNDLVCLKNTHPEDPLSRWITTYLVAVYHRVIGRYTKTPVDADAGLYSYRDSSLAIVSLAIATVLSSILPFSAIVALYLIRDMSIRLGVTAAFTTFFSIALLFITEGRKIEVFMATSAFAAVLVVFIGSTS